MTRHSPLLAAALLAAAVPAVAQEAAPAAPKALSVVLLQARMDPPIDSLPADQRAMLADWKFADIERLIPERAPAVLQANGFAGDAVVIPGVDGAPDLTQLPADRALLVLRVHDVAQTHPRFFVTAGTVHVEVSFYAAGNGAARAPTCHGLSGGTLGFDPVWGIAKTVRVDARWVDGIVAGALDLAARQGCVTLDGARVVFPKT
jgi:hypothetical protein